MPDSPAPPKLKPAAPRRRRWPAVVGVVAAVAVALAGTLWFVMPALAGPAAQTLTLHRVGEDDLIVTIKKDGELQAIRSTDITSRVEGQATLVELVPEGTRVEAGDVIGRLDSSNIEREMQETELELRGAEADLVNAKEELEIQRSQVEADNQAAEVELTLAELDLKQYEEGVYPQLEADARTKVEMARIDLKNAEEELLQTRTLFGKDFVTGAEVKKKELAVVRLRNALEKAETDYNVLVNYTHPKDLTSKRNTLAQKQQKVARTARRGQASLSQREANVNRQELRLLNRKERMAWCQDQMEACELIAPKSGLVVYGAAGNQREQDQIAEGVTVRERQTIVRLPDTTDMKAVLKINESRVGQVEPGQRAELRVSASPAPLGANVQDISVVADSNRRWFNPDVREYPVELVLDHTPSNLKPGMKVQATIFVDRAESVLSVPLTAVYSVGTTRFVFTPDGQGGAEPREVQVGLMNETHAEVRTGLEQGEQVVLLEVGQGRELLERAGVEVAPQRRPGPPAEGEQDADQNSGQNNGGGENANARPARPAA